MTYFLGLHVAAWDFDPLPPPPPPPPPKRPTLRELLTPEEYRERQRRMVAAWHAINRVEHNRRRMAKYHARKAARG